MANDGKTNNKPERIWNDPPMPDEEPLRKRAENLTLGGNVPPEVKRLVVMLDRSNRMQRLISTIITAVSFTIAYAILTSLPEITQSDIMQFFVLATVFTAIAEVAHYYKIF